MATFLYRLGRWCATHGWRVVAGWLVLLLALGAAAAAFGTKPSSVVKIPGAQFQAVMDDLGREIPEVSGNMGTVVFRSEDGAFTPAQRQAIRATLDRWQDAPHVSGAIDPFDTQRDLDRGAERLQQGQDRLDRAERRLARGQERLVRAEGQLGAGEAALKTLPAGSAEAARLRAQLDQGRERLADGRAQLDEGRQRLADGRLQLLRGENVQRASEGVRFVSEDGDAALSQIRFDLDPRSLDQVDRDRLLDDTGSLEKAGVDAYFGSELANEMTVVGPAEVIGVVTAAVVLVVTLGSLIASGLPLLIALFGVATGLAGAVAASHYFEMHMMTPALALMLGLAVGIDYTLFIVNRHRTQVLGGMELRESIGRSVGTAGNAVVFAGATVVVALSALFMSGIPILGQMGFVAAGAVVSAVLLAVTLGPAVLGLIGRRVVSRRAWRRAEERHAAGLGDEVEEEHGGAFVRLVTARPWLTIGGVLVVVALLAAPLQSLRLGLPDGSSEDPDSSAYQAYSTIADEFGPGMNGPLLVVASLDEGTSAEQARITQSALATTFAGYPGVASVVPVGISDDDDTLAYQVVLRTGPTDAETSQTVHAILDQAEEVGEANDATIGVTGQTVANIEISERLGAALPPYLVVVVGLSLVILLFVFRSVVVPLIATGGFLLSISAAFGATVAVFQWGWLGDLFGVHEPGPIMSFGPILLIGVLFGLAMDYQMFLVSGMREAHAHGQDARTAVRSGFVHGAKVVTAAAAIMFAVFGGFVFSHMVMIRPIGFGLAVGVLVDAVLIRMVLTPAVMHLLGERAWWIPRWLDRITPDFDVEGAALSARLEEASPAEPEPDEPSGERQLEPAGR